jgi:hypothetical protein
MIGFNDIVRVAMFLMLLRLEAIIVCPVENRRELQFLSVR